MRRHTQLSQGPPDGAHPLFASVFLLGVLYFGLASITFESPLSWIWTIVAAASFIWSFWQTRKSDERLPQLFTAFTLINFAMGIRHLGAEIPLDVVQFALLIIAARSLDTKSLIVAVCYTIAAECGWFLFSDPNPIVVAKLAGADAMFMVLGAMILQVRVRTLDARYRRESLASKAEMEDKARSYHLTAARHTGEYDRETAEKLVTKRAVESVDHALFLALSLLKQGLRCHTAALLWFDVKNERLEIRELISDSDGIVEVSIDPARGVLGGLTRRREAMLLNDIRPNFRGLAYYRKTHDVTGFIGVPIIEDGRLRGLLCVDRNSGTPFDDEDVAVVEETTSQILRSIENERVFLSIERSKYELGRFFDASKRLNDALSLTDSYGAAAACIQDIVGDAVVAFTTCESGERHKVVYASGTDDFFVDGWKGIEFDDESGLVSMVVRNRHYLPFGGHIRDGKSVLFDANTPLPGFQSLIVLPLVAQDTVIGTLIIGTERFDVFNQERREMLEVVANQIAVTLHNAAMFERMKEMATTDGLTGLANHRTFQSKLDETIARNKRNNTEFCLLLTDIDHFKNVNDTHGHPAGDEVLRQFASTFHEALRETDIPCRYGGEEFSIILDSTDLDGAIVIANRVREEVKKLKFESDAGEFSCTLSIGVAAWPGDAIEKQALIECSDQALYASKEGGRDCVTAFASMHRNVG